MFTFFTGAALDDDDDDDESSELESEELELDDEDSTVEKKLLAPDKVKAAVPRRAKLITLL